MEDCISYDLSGESTTYNEENSLTSEAYTPIINELIEDAVWDVCFEVHRAAQHGILLVDDTQNNNLDNFKESSSGQTLKPKNRAPLFPMTCPVCSRSICGTKYATHLEKCINMGGRVSSRAATKRIVEQANDEEQDSDSSVKNEKKRTKTNSGKNRKKTGRGQGTTYPDFEKMTYEGKVAFFVKCCGVRAKGGNKMCMNSHNCSHHTDQQRRDVRRSLLRNMEDHITNDGQIDVDTVDEGIGRLDFCTDLTNCF